jgi:hypothetical protein
VPEAVLQTSARVEKPNGKDFVRVNPDPAYQLVTLLIVAPGLRKDLYLIHPDIVPDLAGDAQPYVLYMAMGGERVPFIWPCRWAALGDDGASTWHTPQHLCRLLALVRQHRDFGFGDALSVYGLRLETPRRRPT